MKMNRTEFACYALLVSAFLLGGMLIVQIQSNGPLTSTAQAEMVLTSGDMTVMTARTKDDEEALFVLDNVSQELHIYTLDLAKKRLRRNESIRMSRIFGNRDGGKDDDRGHGAR
jgi:hypothetical protein